MTGVRGLVPAPLQQLGRQSYIRLGQLTAQHRLVPNFLLLGASRCGTTSLFRALSAHPQVQRPAANKGIRYFDVNYQRGWSWYRGHFPLARGHQKITFEASGYYIFHPLAAERITADLPKAKLVVLLRDPVERAYSAWKHESARGFETETFARALELESTRLAGEVTRIRAEPGYASHELRHQSHRARGEYADQLDRYLRKAPRTQLHIMISEDFFREPEREYRQLLDFLELPQHDPGGFQVHNARPSSPLDSPTRRELIAHFAPHNARLEHLLGRPLDWQ